MHTSAPLLSNPPQRVCAKVFQTKRAAFHQDVVTEETKAAGDVPPAAATTVGGKKTKKTALPAAVPGSGGSSSSAAAATGGGRSKGAAWAAKSAALRAAMRSAREYTEAIAAGKSGSDLPPPPPSEVDPDLVPCPNCGRRFSDKAAERHIPKCASIIARPKALSKGSGLVAGAHAAAARGCPLRVGEGEGVLWGRH